MTDVAAPLARLPLTGLHRKLGARLGAFLGHAIPLVYGEPAAEDATLRERCGLLDLSFLARLELLGEDRQRFLNGLVTCDVKSLRPGEGAYGFFTAQKGQVLADVVVLALVDRLWLMLPAGKATSIDAHLKKYRIADRVELMPLDDLLPLALVGPGAAAALGPIAVGEASWSNAKTMLLGSEVHVARWDRLGAPACVLWVSASVAGPLVEALIGERGVEPVGVEAAETLRVEAGIGRCGQDFGEDHFPQETGAEGEAVSYTKGCYLGQEVVARIHYRGGVQRALRGLRFASAEPPALDTPVLAGAEPVGRVTSVCRSPRLGAIGLAVLHKKAGEPGARVALAGGGAAEIVDLPFDSRAPVAP